jgi:anaerobic selenocysteine-containing dehydrogenase
METQRDRVVRTVCGIEDGVSCGILAHVRDGVLVKVEPADFPDGRFRHICARGLCTVKLVYHPDRLRHPLRRVGERGEGRWERISWDEALETIADKFRKIGTSYGYESIAFATGQVATSALMMIYLRLASALQATSVSLAGFGDAAGPCGDLLSYGVVFGEFYTSGMESPRSCVLWGANLAETHPIRWRTIRDARENGAKLVVIDPRFTTTASKADEYISIRPGTDAALALGVMRVIFEKGLEDKDFISRYTVGPFLVRGDDRAFLRERDVIPGGSEKFMVWDTERHSPGLWDDPKVRPALSGVYHIAGIECRTAFQSLRDLADLYPLHRVSEITGVDSGTVERLAELYAGLRPVASYRGWGLQRTFHGDLSYRAVTALAAVTGNIRLEAHRGFKLNKKAFIKAGEGRFRSMPIMKLYQAVLTGHPYPVKALWAAAHNFMNQNPDNDKILKEILPRLELIVVADMFMNSSAHYADIVLPTCSFFERPDLIPPFEPFNPYLQLQPKVIEPLYESRSDLEIVNGLASRLGLGGHFSRSAEQWIELLLCSGHPSVAGVTLERLRHGPVELPPYEAPLFLTPSGRLEFYCESMRPFGQELPVYREPLEGRKSPLAERYPLSMLSTHTKYRKHSMFANVPWLRRLDPEPVVEMNPSDAEARHISDGDMVSVFNDRGSVKLKARPHEGMRGTVVNIRQGWWHSDYREGTHQALTHSAVNPAQEAAFEPNAALYDTLVEVARAEER